MDEEDRDDILDMLPDNPVIWADDEETQYFQHANLRWWLDALGHPTAHRGCCKTCGCATTCMAGAFHQAVVDATIRELDRIGALVKPERPACAPESPQDTRTAPAPTRDPHQSQEDA